MTEGKGLYVPGADGGFRFQGIKEEENRPVLTYEKDTGVILFNFNLILLSNGRKVQDIIMQTQEGLLMGLVLTSTAMGPEELARQKIAQEKTHVG